MAHKPCITAGLVTVCSSINMVPKTSRTIDLRIVYADKLQLTFPVKEATSRSSVESQTLADETSKLILKSWAESLAFMTINYEWLLPEVNSAVHNPYCLWAACPCPSWSIVALYRSHLHWVWLSSFVPQYHHLMRKKWSGELSPWLASTLQLV